MPEDTLGSRARWDSNGSLAPGRNTYSVATWQVLFSFLRIDMLRVPERATFNADKHLRRHHLSVTTT